MKLEDAEKMDLMKQLQAIRVLAGNTADEQLSAQQAGIMNQGGHYTAAVNDLAKAQARVQDSTKKTGHSFLSSNSSTLSDVFNLIKDGINGKMNDYLQELLSNAEIMAAVKNKDAKDPNSRKVLEINVTIASTMIDKYAGLLEILLNKKSLSSPQQQLIKDANQSISHAAERLRRVNFMRAFNSLDDYATVYMAQHHKNSCFSNWFSSSPSRAYNNLIHWFEDLTREPLSAKELMGAIYTIRKQIGQLKNEEERAAIRDGLDEMLKENACPAFSIEASQGELKEYIDSFGRRIAELGLQWPAPFAAETLPVLQQVMTA
ncbi:hypothetical protein [Legionella quinlivanii]|uniref:hypothetical protein n=1 Tax=Legionella quinlivanii TaxID=45073 RepID=UPI0022432E22|nr:hypothetical protein [Legionella quinlivanii]MCW8452362.1 hypothetical protein [Legionella quinlivanii]